MTAQRSLILLESSAFKTFSKITLWYSHEFSVVEDIIEPLSVELVVLLEVVPQLLAITVLFYNIRNLVN